MVSANGGIQKVKFTRDNGETGFHTAAAQLLARRAPSTMASGAMARGTGTVCRCIQTEVCSTANGFMRNIVIASAAAASTFSARTGVLSKDGSGYSLTTLTKGTLLEASLTGSESGHTPWTAAWRGSKHLATNLSAGQTERNRQADRPVRGCDPAGIRAAHLLHRRRARRQNDMADSIYILIHVLSFALPRN